jgi:anti-anti-sigma factor
MPLEASIEEIDGTAVVTIHGNMTLGTRLKTIDDQLQTLIGQGTRKVLFDLGAVAYCDSAGLGMLVHTYGLLREKGGSVRLCGVSERVMALLKMTMTDTFMPIDPDRITSLSAHQA